MLICGWCLLFFRSGSESLMYEGCTSRSLRINNNLVRRPFCRDNKSAGATSRLLSSISVTLPPDGCADREFPLRRNGAQRIGQEFDFLVRWRMQSLIVPSVGVSISKCAYAGWNSLVFTVVYLGSHPRTWKSDWKCIVLHARVIRSVFAVSRPGDVSTIGRRKAFDYQIQRDA